MAQKIITIILALAVVGGMAWYINKYYLESSKSDTSVKVTTKNANILENNNSESQNVIYVTYSTATEIWSSDEAANKKKIFTDADETAKILTLSNVASSAGEVLAVTSPGAGATGTLMAIDLTSAKERKVINNFANVENLTVNADSSQIAFTRFSNVEADYGYSLYHQRTDGGTPLKVLSSQSALGPPSFSPSGAKIAFAQTNGASTDLSSFSFSSGATSKIASYENQVIDWVSWEGTDKILVSLRKTGNNNSGVISSVDPNTGKSVELAEYSGGHASFIHLASSRLAFIVAQYNNGVDQKIQGQMYIVSLNTKSKTTLEKANQILGWL